MGAQGRLQQGPKGLAPVPPAYDRSEIGNGLDREPAAAKSMTICAGNEAQNPAATPSMPRVPRKSRYTAHWANVRSVQSSATGARRRVLRPECKFRTRACPTGLPAPAGRPIWPAGRRQSCNLARPLSL